MSGAADGISLSLKATAGGLTATFDQKVRFVERSARTQRYHSQPTLHAQSVGEHTYGVMMLIHLMTGGKASAALLTAALLHDTPECATGDVPGPVKRAADVGEAFEALESRVMAYYGIEEPKLDSAEASILKLADNLEGLSYCAFEARMGNREIQDCYMNYLAYVSGSLVRMTVPNAFALNIWNKYKEEYDNTFGK